MLGAESMLKAVLNAMGFDPMEFMKGMQAFVTSTHNQMLDFDERIKRMEASHVAMHVKLDAILAHLKAEKNHVGLEPGHINGTIYIDHNRDDAAERTGAAAASGGE